jgi:hypothetical protein
MTRRLAIALGFTGLLLTGCVGGPPSDNTDPRDGRVYTTWSSCVYGACISDWKVCIGRDLLIHLSDTDEDYMVRDSPECAP